MVSRLQIVSRGFLAYQTVKFGFLPPGNVTIEAVIADHLFDLVRDMGIQTASQSKPSKAFSFRLSLDR